MLNTAAAISLGAALVCAIAIAADEVRHPQKMWVMNIVWPVTALYLSVFAVWAYFRKGRTMSKEASATKEASAQMSSHERGRDVAPTWGQAALSDSHCGAGCTIADIATEFAVFAAGATLLGSELYASYLWDFVVAWLVGIFFQYFMIQPMRNLTVAGGLWAAAKADTLSILTFQIGMYGWMALVYFRLFPNPHLHPNEAGYWLMMQIAMVCGFVTALPVNWLLVKIGWKEAMG